LVPLQKQQFFSFSPSRSGNNPRYATRISLKRNANG
jgi:hypothetical protein